MKKRKIIVLLALAALLLSLAPSLSVQVEEVEQVWIYEGDYDDEIDVEVEATTQAYPGDIITFAIVVEALEDLEDVTMDIWVEGSSGEGAERWKSAEKEVLDRDDLNDGEDFDDEYEFVTSKTGDPGTMLGHVTSNWDVWDEDLEEWVTHSFDIAFPATFLLGAISEEKYNQLRDDYTELQAVYVKVITERDTWKADFNSLESEYITLNDNYNSLTTTYNNITSSYDSLTTTYKNLKSDYNSLKSENDILVNDHNALQDRYDSLNSEYEPLLKDHEALKLEYKATSNELENYKIYTYVLAIITVIFIVTTIIFGVRKAV